MKFKEIKNMNKEELKAKLKELRLDLMKQDAQVATGKVPQNPGQMKIKKKNIARILSVLEGKKHE